MPNSNWRQNIRHVEDGQAVNAGNTSRPDRDLAANQRYLKEWLEEADLGEAIVAHEVTIDPDLLPGQPVYFDAVEKRYAPAFAAVEPDATAGTLVMVPSAECIGILGYKHNTTLGTVILGGRVKIDLSLAVEAEPDGPQPGRYYVSPATPGRLVRQRPPITVSVLYYDGEYAHVMPIARDFLEDHIHYKFDLVALPAGESPECDANEHHEITVADPDAQGWLPADHEVFEGLAPEGAVFGYNLSQHLELSRVWPPIPITAAAVEVERPALLYTVGDRIIGGTTQDSRFVLLTQHGIWWMSSCYNQAPWPADHCPDVSSSLSASSASSQSAGLWDDCPEQRMRITLHFAKAVFATDKSVVTSLQPAEGSPIEVLNCDGGSGKTGDLHLALNLSFLVDAETEIYGGEVLKQLDGVTFRKGWVAEGVIAGNNVTVTGTRQRALQSEEADALQHAGPLHQGIIRLDVDLSPGERELAPQIIKLGDARERTFRETPHIGFPDGRVSAVRLKFNIPPVGLPATPQLKIRVQLLGRAAGTLPDLDMTRRNVARADDSPVALPDDTSEQDVTFDSAQVVGANEYLEIESDGFDVAAGDTVFVTVSRASDDDYAGEVGALRFGGVLFAGGS